MNVPSHLSSRTKLQLHLSAPQPSPGKASAQCHMIYMAHATAMLPPLHIPTSSDPSPITRHTGNQQPICISWNRGQCAVPNGCPARSPLCEQALQCTLRVCGELGVQVAEEKTEGPATSLTFLGIELDSQRMQIRLPQEKLTNLLALLNWWMHSPRHLHAPRRTGTKRTSSPSSASSAY